MKDTACPLNYEPSGQDFLSPCLAEADLMRRVLPPDALRDVARHVPAATPTRRVGAAWLSPAVVTDPSDPKLAHLDGLNLSRAWMLRRHRARPAAVRFADRRAASDRGGPSRGRPASRDRRALRGRPLAGHVRRVPRDRREPSLALSTRCRRARCARRTGRAAVDCQNGNYFLPDDDKAMLYVYRIE